MTAMRRKASFCCAESKDCFRCKAKISELIQLGAAILNQAPANKELGVMPRGSMSAPPSEIVTEFLLRRMAQMAQLTRDNPKI